VNPEVKTNQLVRAI